MRLAALPCLADVLDACARRDLGVVIAALADKRAAGLAQGQIAELTGISQGRLGEWATGKRKPAGVAAFQKLFTAVSEATLLAGFSFAERVFA